ncbi:MAG TPA: hypothetical protein PK610_13780, partial [Flavobacteriales bacterium]|nr:hypothetical protein [Flavobacteriales bacterium]
TDNLQQITLKARNYHQLIDCPMMFSPADTAQFFVNKTKVTISVYDVQGQRRAKQFYNALKRDMEAIAAFLPELPVDSYTFIIFVDDLREIGQAFTGKIGLGKRIKLAKKFGNLGLGALEHGNSSTYYLGDFGPGLDIEDLSLEGQLTGAAIHEFMHIVTPLGLHSQHIGNFNYTNPVMSKHLWLYEGITEYFAHLVKYKGGVYTPDQFLKEMSLKFSSGVSFPIQEMSFTEMSANVLQPKYEKHYGQVYQRGAAMGMLLDAEIQRLTDGKKELIDVILTLVNRYGAEKSFDEESFIDEFVAEVHPDLKNYFTLYVEGKNQWKPNDQLIGMKVVYYDTLRENSLLNPLSPYDNEIRTSDSKGGLEKTITQVGSGEFVGFRPGDKVDVLEFLKALKKPNGDPVDPDQEVIVTVIRDNQPKKLMFKARYGMKTKVHVLKWIQR